ncbi:MAG: 1-deoxy-D-xylulose-5-phosphate synthase [Ruminococcaceae bacterium]|nr:1-deoxy-D-xylulose-5-phosphate synthase [Oscillospiraceae bacterium]
MNKRDEHASAFPILSAIDSPDDIKRLSPQELPRLCKETRRFLLQTLSKTGGHVASNLGVVELTTAIHRCFDTGANDRLVFDVGHQCYAHKLYTGRRNGFDSLRKKDGLSGFPKPSESKHDAFVAGHGSTSVSVALGLARAQSLLPPDKRGKVIAVIGDGAMGGGLAYEGLNDAGASGLPVIVVLNDNGMSIGQSVGAVSRMLTRFRVKEEYRSAKQKYHSFMRAVPGGQQLNRVFSGVKDSIKHSIIPSTFFETLGFEYIGPVDGHDVFELCRIFETAKTFNGPVLIHAVTQKGHGYKYSEGSPESFHGVDSFDLASGRCKKGSGETFSAAFGKELCELAEADPKICAITAAMGSGVGLSEFSKRFPDRYFDVGIAEEHAVTMAAGMAAEGSKPIVAIYSTFLQRAYDEILHDVGIMHLPVVFCVDRAGFVGEDGETHQGLYDLAMLKSIPGMEILMPANTAELRTMLRYALSRTDGPTAIRYPRGRSADFSADTAAEPLVLLRKGRDLTLAAAGRLIDTAVSAAETLAAQGVDAAVLKLNHVHPLPTDEIFAAVSGEVIVLEECAAAGSMGVTLAASAERRVHRINCGEHYVAQGSVAEQCAACGLDVDSIVKTALSLAAKAPQNISVAPATEIGLATLWSRNIEKNPGDSRWIRWRDEYIAGNQTGAMRTFAVCVDGDPVGEGTLLFSPDCSAIGGRTVLADGKTVANLNALRITGKYECQGHISALVKEMEAYAAHAGYKALTIGVAAKEARNLAIYLHWGYTHLVHSEIEDGELVLYYEKELR